MKRTLSKWLTLAKDKLTNSLYLAVLSAYALAQGLMALIEFLLHVLRIPHWH